jgi:CitMHS family citrate-Mg2+:H+ or citrate-Ca2+:H+ symporter
MLTALAYAMILVFMALIMTKRLSAMVALITVPIVFGLIGGFGMDLGPMMLDGIKKLAPTGVMLMFAILYFGIMIDAGLFDPAVRWILRLVGNDPSKIVMGTFVLATCVSLDGDGSTTYMITCAAMLPLYRRLGMSRLVLTCVVMMAGGNMNILPWGGPTARAASALGVDVGQLFVPMILPMVVTGAWGILVAFWLGQREKRRLGTIDLVAAEEVMSHDEAVASSVARPGLIWVNLALTVALMVLLILGVFPLQVLFMVAAAIALMINYPRLEQQKDRLEAHAANIVPVVALIFAAGIFVGILSGTKMVDAIAASVIAGLPNWLEPYLAVVTAVLSVPFTFFISNDAFYFGMLPILAEAGAHYGVAPEAIARASLMGQPVHLLSPLVPSTYLLVSLVGIDLADHQRFTLVPAILVCAVMTVVGMIALAFPFVA